MPRWIAAVLVLMCVATCSTEARADRTDGKLEKKTDKPAEFKLKPFKARTARVPPTGYFIGVNDDNRGGLSGDDVETVDGTNWKVGLSHIVVDFLDKPGDPFRGASKVKIRVEGQHKIGPHGSGEPKDKPNDDLTTFTSKELLKLPFGKDVNIRFEKKDPHLLTDGKTNHTDYFGFKGVIRAIKGGDSDRITGNMINHHRVTTKVGKSLLKHTKKKFKQTAMGDSSFGGDSGFAAFDSDFGELTVALELIDSLSGPGGAYDDDPLRGASMVATFQYAESTTEGHLFTDGVVTIFDPAGEFTFDATIPEYLISDTGESVLPRNVGFFDALTITDPYETGEGPAPFLHDFFDTNALGAGLSAARFDNLADIGLTISSLEDLVEATDGFTAAAFIDARVTVGAFFGYVEGDTDGDGVVGIDDLNNVRNSFGGGPGGAAGDVNGDGVVNLVDLNLVRNNFGATAAADSAHAAVPEPAAILLLALGIPALLLRARRADQLA